MKECPQCDRGAGANASILLLPRETADAQLNACKVNFVLAERFQDTRRRRVALRISLDHSAPQRRGGDWSDDDEAEVRVLKAADCSVIAAGRGPDLPPPDSTGEEVESSATVDVTPGADTVEGREL